MLSNFYIKAFLAGFAPLFIAVFIMHYEKDLISLLALLYGLIGGVIFIIFALIHKLIASKYASNEEETTKVNHEKSIILQLPEYEARNIIRKYIDDMNYKVKEEKENFISCKTPITFRSLGTLLSFELQPIDTKNTNIKISTKPFIATTIIDFGDSLSTIKNAEKYLIQKIESPNS